jgi:hypothetical protein
MHQLFADRPMCPICKHRMGLARVSPAGAIIPNIDQGNLLTRRSILVSPLIYGRSDAAESDRRTAAGFGEPRVNAAEVFTLCHVRVVDLCAGTAAQTILHPACVPWIAHSDIREARKIASMVCTSEAAIDAYLTFGLAEAKALIEQHRAAVWAIAESLMVHRTPDSTQIDDIIAAAPERERRAEWARVLENVTQFAAGLER